MGVGAGTAAEEGDRGAFPGHQEHRRGFADVDAIARARKRLATRRRGGFEGVEAVGGQATQGIRAAADHRVAQAELQQALRAEQRAGTGRAGRGYPIAGTAERQPFGEEGGGGTELLVRIAVRGRPLAGPAAAGDAARRFLDAGGAGTDDDADAVGAVARDGVAKVDLDLLHGQHEQAVVAGIPVRQVRRHVGQRGLRVAQWQRLAGHPAVERTQAARGGGEQGIRHDGLAGTERAHDAQGIEVGRHAISPACAPRRSRGFPRACRSAVRP